MEILKYLIVLLIITFVSCTKKTTISDSRNDSVEKYLKLASIDTLPTEIRKKHNHKAFSFIDLEKNDSVVRWYLCQTALNYSLLKDSLNYYKISRIHYFKSAEVNDTLNLARFYRYRGGFHKNNLKAYDSSFFYYIKSEKLYLLTNKINELTIIYSNKSIVQERLTDYLGAEYSITKAYKQLEKNNNPVDYYNFLNSVGNLNQNTGNYNLAIKYHSKALSLSQSQKLKSEGIPISFEGTSLNNLGNAYRELKQYDKALYYLNKAIKNKEMVKIDPELKGYLFNNIGFCLMNKNIKKLYITKYFKTAAKVFDSLQMKDESAISRIYLAYYYAKIKDTTSAIQYSNQALELAKESKSSYYYLYTLSSAGTINKQKAPQYIAEYHRLNDSILFEERKARNQYFKIQLETDEITQQKEKAIKQKWVQTSIIASVLFIVILLFIIYKQRSQKKEFILIQNQQKANEEIYQLMLNQQSKEEEAKQKEKKRIAIELHDNVMNKLASTRFNLFSLTKKSDVQSLEQAVHHIDSIKEVEDEIRNITHELSKETFSKSNSFASLLTQMINEQNQIHSTHYQLELDTTINWDMISSEIKMNYYRIIQEAIHNCNKYAVASHCTVSLFYEMNQLRLTISDNGKGFEVEATKQGIGLQNMKQRMESIEGNISINSGLGKGTVINCTVEIDVNL